MRKLAAITALTIAAGTTFAVAESPALAASAPSITSLSVHSAAYWSGRQVTVRGANFATVRKVVFGSQTGYGLRVISPSTLTVYTPYHSRGTVWVHVVTGSGTSRASAASKFVFRRPTMSDPIQGGLTGWQAQQVSAKVRKHHHTPARARNASRWTAAMGVTAAKRAASWIGLPYSWAGGNGSGPTRGVCAGDGGDLDCHIVGFDCSGLSLNSWAPYKGMAHYAATQYRTAGRYHPGVGELLPGDLVFFGAYIPGGIGHVAVYEGNGVVIEAPQSGSTVRRSRLVDLMNWDGYRGATRPRSTGRQGAAPVVTSVTATAPTKGGIVTVSGRNLASTTAITIAGTTTYKLLSRSSGHVTVQVPAHKAGKVTIGVSNAWGTAKRTVTYVAPPSISSLSQNKGPTTGGNVITVSGRGLSTVSSVLLDNKAIAFTRTGTATAPMLSITMPAHRAGPVTVKLNSAYGPSGTKTYTYYVAQTPPAPSPTPTSTATSPPTSTRGPKASMAPAASASPSSSAPR